MSLRAFLLSSTFLSPLTDLLDRIEQAVIAETT